MSRKVIRVLIVIVCAAVLLTVAYDPQNALNATTSLDIGRIRLLLIGVVIVMVLQSILIFALYSKMSKPHEITESPEVSNPEENEERGRGRPRDPCPLAKSGVIKCPLVPNLGFSPEFIERVTDSVMDRQQKLIQNARLGPPKIVPEPSRAQEASPESPKPPTFSKPPPGGASQGTGTSKEQQSEIGTLAVDLAAILVKPKEKEKAK